MSSDAPLTGVELLCPDLSYDFDEYPEGYKYITERAARLGAVIIQDETGEPDFHQQYLSNPLAFTVRGSDPLIKEKTAELYAEGAVHRPMTKDYPDCTNDDLAQFPFILAGKGTSGGEGKYLIENEDQLACFQQLVDLDHRKWGFRQRFEFREWVPTPSDHYTSYRVITAATGMVLAAGLLYSGHTETNPKKRIAAKPGRLITKDTNMWGESALVALESPHSSYFLNAKNPCSNLEQGGQCIPLMGDWNRQLSMLEEEILQAHGIDPQSRALPPDIHRQAEIIGQRVGKFAGLLIGADFLQHRDTGQGLFSEVNTGPGISTWNECWNGGAANAATAWTIRQMLDSALDSIVATFGRYA